MNPYISFIVCCRNDNYAGNFTDKLQLSLNFLAYQCDKYDLNAEVILVEWNPPEKNLPIEKILDFSKCSYAFDLKIIRVPNHIHNLYKNADKIAINVPLSFNVGIRRARGKFVVLRAGDVFYSNEIIEYIAKEQLEENKVYRCSRYDVNMDVEVLKKMEYRKIIDSMVHNEHNCMHGPLILPTYPPVLNVHTNASGDFLLSSIKVWNKVRGLRETKDAISMDHDGLALNAMVSKGFDEIILPAGHAVYKLSHSEHTFNKIVMLPVTPYVEAIENYIIKSYSEWCRDTSTVIPARFGDKVRFWVRLLFDNPKRAVKRIGAVDCNSYTYYLYYAFILYSKVNGGAKLFQKSFYWIRSNIDYFKKAFSETLSFSIKVINQSGEKGLYIKIIKQCLLILKLYFDPYPHLMNNKKWGLSNKDLPVKIVEK